MVVARVYNIEEGVLLQYGLLKCVKCNMWLQNLKNTYKGVNKQDWNSA